ncbi:hypothetical protein CEXT_167891 [Caerostris extrusa]|uniref:Uncharacterized protein n=1 Tax=Caerostris extrusa TaxID=172846 RepID=A0AAV4N0T9_CAEEX|nr:hypothetical protein CEXT_167891 [Caerostris extrusa]
MVCGGNDGKLCCCHNNRSALISYVLNKGRWWPISIKTLLQDTFDDIAIILDFRAAIVEPTEPKAPLIRCRERYHNSVNWKGNPKTSNRFPLKLYFKALRRVEECGYMTIILDLRAVFVGQAEPKSSLIHSRE